MGLWKFPKLDLECLSFFFLSPHILVPSIFKHFLIELGCWNFRCGLGQPLCMRLFRIFVIESPCFPRGPLNNFAPPPQKLNYSFIVWFWWNLKKKKHFHMFTNNNGDTNVWTLQRILPPTPFTKKSNSSFIARFWLNLKHNIFICLPKII